MGGNARKDVFKCQRTESCDACFQECAPKLLEACKDMVNTAALGMIVAFLKEYKGHEAGFSPVLEGLRDKLHAAIAAAEQPEVKK